MIPPIAPVNPVGVNPVAPVDPVGVDPVDPVDPVGVNPVDQVDPVGVAPIGGVVNDAAAPTRYCPKGQELNANGDCRLTKASKIALGVVLGVLGLIALILLIVCCWKCCAARCCKRKEKVVPLEPVTVVEQPKPVERLPTPVSSSASEEEVVVPTPVLVEAAVTSSSSSSEEEIDPSKLVSHVKTSSSSSSSEEEVVVSVPVAKAPTTESSSSSVESLSSSSTAISSSSSSALSEPVIMRFNSTSRYIPSSTSSESSGREPEVVFATTSRRLPSSTSSESSGREPEIVFQSKGRFLTSSAKSSSSSSEDEEDAVDVIFLVDGSESMSAISEVIRKQLNSSISGLRSRSSPSSTVTVIQYSGVRQLEASYRPGFNGVAKPGQSPTIYHYKVEMPSTTISQASGIESFETLNGNSQLYLCLQDICTAEFRSRLGRGGRRSVRIIIISDGESDIGNLHNANGNPTNIADVSAQLNEFLDRNNRGTPSGSLEYIIIRDDGIKSLSGLDSEHLRRITLLFNNDIARRDANTTIVDADRINECTLQ